MSSFKVPVNFNIFHPYTLQEWVDLDEGGYSGKGNQRFAKVSSEYLDDLEKSRNEANTVKQTGWALKTFIEWAVSENIDVNLATVGKMELADLLRRFYGAVRTAKGELYGISSYMGIRAGLNRHLNEPPISRSFCLMKDVEFTAANNVFAGVVKKLRKEGLDQTTHHPAITPGDIAKLRASSAMSPATPRGLQNKVWFDIQLHFGRRGKEGNRDLKPDSFVIKTDENGTRLVF